MCWIQRWLKYSRHQTTEEDTIMNAASVRREFSAIELAYKQTPHLRSLYPAGGEEQITSHTLDTKTGG